MTTVFTPYDLAAATQTGPRVFRKQVLKKGTISYQGQRIEFDDRFLRGVVKAFRGGAYDQVPFQFADPENRHNMDPDKFRGEVKGLELTDDGVDAIIEATPEGAEVIQKNPRLGVSARIVTDLSKSDGRKYPVAIQHILATMDPRLTGMRPWQSVDLSEDDDDEDDVLDLTAARFKEGNKVGTKTRKKTAAPQVVQIDLSQLDDSVFKDLLLAAVEEAEADTDTEEVTRTTRETVKRKTPKQRRQQAVEDLDEEDDEDLEEDDEDVESDEVLDEDESEDEELDEEVDEDEEEERPVAKKSKKRKDVKLSAPVVKRRKVDRARRLELKLAAQEWSSQRGDLARAGVPPHLLDLAAPIMSQPDALVIDLSESGEPNADAKAIVAKMLDSVRGFIDLAPEMGHGISSISDDENDPTRRSLAVWEKEYGKP